MKSKNCIYYKNEKYKIVYVAGTFNNWGNELTKTESEKWLMKLNENDLWYLELPKLKPGKYEYKYIINGKWEEGQNRFFDISDNNELCFPNGNIHSITIEKKDLLYMKLYSPVSNVDDIKLKIIPEIPITGKLFYKTKNGFDPEKIVIRTEKELDISNLYKAEVIVNNKKVDLEITPGNIFYNDFISNKELGVSYCNKTKKTIFRVFSPRAKEVELLIFSKHNDNVPFNKEKLTKDDDGIWETSFYGEFYGKFYGYHIKGIKSKTTQFNEKMLLPDIYSKLNIYHDGKSMITVPEKKFNWTDKNFKPTKPEDIILCELSIRDYTSDDSSEVNNELKGKFSGLCETEYLDTGIDHLKKMGFNTVEFLPIQEFDDNPHGNYHWGYMTSLYFCPETSYSYNILDQLNELKELINTLHNNGITVIMDVVYNHTGEPHYLKYYDWYYYYRTTDNFYLMNFSGCGNDVRSEHPMTRKLIIDSILYWMKEFHIDGFRFDLAELIDLETLYQIRKKGLELNPDAIFIAEPWSFRGMIKDQLKGSGWLSWNDDFRNKIKDFVIYNKGRDYIPFLVKGCCDWWAENPIQSVNYVESHDNYTLTDFISSNTEKNGKILTKEDIQLNKLCAVFIFTSLGIPMLAQGQEFLRSKGGNENSYNASDKVNCINWDYRNKYSKTMEFYRKLINLRSSEIGNVFRIPYKPDNNYIKFIFPANLNSIGYIFNNNNSISSKRVMTLINTDKEKTIDFQDRSLIGKWNIIISTWNTKFNKYNIKRSYDPISIPALSAIIAVEI